MRDIPVHGGHERLRRARHKVHQRGELTRPILGRESFAAGRDIADRLPDDLIETLSDVFDHPVVIAEGTATSTAPRRRPAGPQASTR